MESEKNRVWGSTWPVARINRVTFIESEQESRAIPAGMCPPDCRPQPLQQGEAWLEEHSKQRVTFDQWRSCRGSVRSVSAVRTGTMAVISTSTQYIVPHPVLHQCCGGGRAGMQRKSNSYCSSEAPEQPGKPGQPRLERHAPLPTGSRANGMSQFLVLRKTWTPAKNNLDEVSFPSWPSKVFLSSSARDLVGDFKRSQENLSAFLWQILPLFSPSLLLFST